VQKPTLGILQRKTGVLPARVLEKKQVKVGAINEENDLTTDGRTPPCMTEDGFKKGAQFRRRGRKGDGRYGKQTGGKGGKPIGPGRGTDEKV